MPKKRTSMDSILPPNGPPKVTAKKKVRKKPVEEEAPTTPPEKKKQPNRKQLALYLEGPIYQQLRTIAFEEETKMHPLLLEGLDRVFSDRGLPSITELLDKEG